MGIALARAAVDYGADVELVLGPVQVIPSDPGINIINVVTADSMAKECIDRFGNCDIAILCAAVADFTPEIIENKKIKKNKNGMILRLKPTIDIAETLGKSKKSSQILVGFALETNDGVSNATSKLRRKNLDFIVLNSPHEEGSGFGYDTNRITIIDRNNNIDKFGLKSKDEVARDILDKIASMIR
jgi:phosphopantothenoylcysteine decarboxylase/phosphopantothenate--cysteine ligase